MMNKALEVIEARFLFGVAPEQIQVVIHPQSVIHSMVQYIDHSVVAQLGTPDMRGPGTTAVLNAANEVAVAAFLDRQIRYDQIHHINLETLNAVIPQAPTSLEDLLSLDQQTRAAAQTLVARWCA